MSTAQKGKKKTMAGAVKSFSLFKPGHKPKKQTHRILQTKAASDSKEERFRAQMAERRRSSRKEDESEMFDPSLVRMSVLENDALYEYSMNDLDDFDRDIDDTSSDGSMYTEEEKKVIMANHRSTSKFPGDLAASKEHSGGIIASSSDDEDHIYIDEEESIYIPPKRDSMAASEDDDDEEDEEDTFDPNNQISFQDKSTNTRAAKCQGVTESVIAYTTGDSLGVSINKIDIMMEHTSTRRIQDLDKPPDVIHEDSAALLNQLDRALRPSVIVVDDGYLKAIKDLDSALDEETDKGDRLQRELQKSRDNCLTLEDKLNTSKTKISQIEEVGEQVHMSRGFALQSLRLIHSHAALPARSSLDQVSIREDEVSDESDGDDERLHDFVVIEEEDETSDNEAPEPSGMHVGTNANTSEFKGDIEEQGIEYVVHPPQRYDRESSDKVEKDGASAVQEPPPERSPPRNVSMVDKKSPDEKLRSSLQKAKQMEVLGEQIRRDHHLEDLDVELEETSYSIHYKEDVEGDLKTVTRHSDMQVAELFELRARLQEQQIEIEDLKASRAYNASKVAELTALIQRSAPDDLLRHLGEKSVKVAELNHEVSVLREELSRAKDRSTVLEAERDANKTVIASLSQSLWKKEPLSRNAIIEHRTAHELMKHGGVIPESDAMELTIAALQRKIETLEDKKAAYKDTVDTLTASVTELIQENDAKTRQIQALESQFLMLNKRGSSTTILQNGTTLDSNAVPHNNEKLSRFKAWASNKINLAHEQYENIKTDIDIRRINTNPDKVLI